MPYGVNNHIIDIFIIFIIIIVINSPQMAFACQQTWVPCVEIFIGEIPIVVTEYGFLQSRGHCYQVLILSKSSWWAL